MNNMMTLLITKLFGKKAGEDHLGNKYFYRLVKNNKAVQTHMLKVDQQ